MNEMKDLFQCVDCGFLSTYFPGYIRINGKLHCEYCACENHGVEKKGKSSDQWIIGEIAEVDGIPSEIVEFCNGGYSVILEDGRTAGLTRLKINGEYPFNCD